MLNFLEFILGKEVTNQYFDVCISYLSFLFQSFSVHLHGEYIWHELVKKIIS